MPGIAEFVLGGALPLVSAAAALSLIWFAAARLRPDAPAAVAAAWPLAIALAYAVGVTALDVPGSGFSPALTKLVKPHESFQWLPAAALAAAIMTLAAAGPPATRALGWIAAAALTSFLPWWLMRNGTYLPSVEVRAAGFASELAWSTAQAIAILGGATAAMLIAWVALAAARAQPDLLRSVLTLAVVAAMTATAALTGSFAYAQLLGVLAAGFTGAALAGWVLRVRGGPSLAAGPITVISGSVLLLATCYADMRSLQAVGLWLALLIGGGWLPGQARPKTVAALRVGLTVPILACVVTHAGLEFVETQRQHAIEAESNPYLNY